MQRAYGLQPKNALRKMHKDSWEMVLLSEFTGCVITFASLLPRVIFMRRSEPSTHRVSGHTETTTYGESATVRSHEEQQNLPSRGIFGKVIHE
jgi:hypothetical protein